MCCSQQPKIKQFLFCNDKSSLPINTHDNLNMYEELRTTPHNKPKNKIIYSIIGYHNGLVIAMATPVPVQRSAGDSQCERRLAFSTTKFSDVMTKAALTSTLKKRSEVTHILSNALAFTVKTTNKQQSCNYSEQGSKGCYADDF